MLMKIGPILQNPGRVLLHIVMVGLLSQVMNNANVNVVNENMNVVNKNVNVVNENVSRGNVNVVNGVDEDYAVNKSNVNVDHVVDKSNVYVKYVDVNNADVNNVNVNSVNMNKNTKPVCARAVKDISCELPFKELEEDKPKRSKPGDAQEA
jgi:hypothetical protein